MADHGSQDMGIIHEMPEDLDNDPKSQLGIKGNIKITGENEMDDQGISILDSTVPEQENHAHPPLEVGKCIPDVCSPIHRGRKMETKDNRKGHEMFMDAMHEPFLMIPDGSHEHEPRLQMNYGESVATPERDPRISHQRDDDCSNQKRNWENYRSQYPNDRNEKRRNDKPAPTYDGKSNWEDFFIQFEKTADMNEWGYSRKATELAASLRGTALGVLMALDPNEKAFNSGNLTEKAEINLCTQLLLKGESLVELAQDIRELIRNAFPKAKGEMSHNPPTTEEAVGKATRCEACQFSKQKKQKPRKIFALAEENTAKESVTGSTQQQIPNVKGQQEQMKFRPSFYKEMRCFTCNQPGHKYRECPSRKMKMRCFYCQEYGHGVATCTVRKTEMGMIR